MRSWLARGDFRSVVYPFLAAQERSGIVVREAPFGAIAEAITASTRLVAVSHVHSATGQVADLSAIGRRATEVGALVYVDATQSVGVLDVDVRASGRRRSLVRGIQVALHAAGRGFPLPAEGPAGGPFPVRRFVACCAAAGSGSR